MVLWLPYTTMSESKSMITRWVQGIREISMTYPSKQAGKAAKLTAAMLACGGFMHILACSAYDSVDPAKEAISL